MRWPWRRRLSSAELEVFDKTPPCRHCGGWHARACPRVKRMAFSGGELTEIEFWAHWNESAVTYPDELPELPSGDEEMTTDG